MTWVWPGPLRVSEGKGRNTCHEAGFFSEDSAIWLLGEFLHTEHDMSIDFRGETEGLMERQLTLGKTRFEASRANNPLATKSNAATRNNEICDTLITTGNAQRTRR